MTRNSSLGAIKLLFIFFACLLLFSGSQAACAFGLSEKGAEICGTCYNCTLPGDYTFLESIKVGACLSCGNDICESPFEDVITCPEDCASLIRYTYLVAGISIESYCMNKNIRAGEKKVCDAYVNNTGQTVETYILKAAGKDSNLISISGVERCTVEGLGENLWCIKEVEPGEIRWMKVTLLGLGELNENKEIEVKAYLESNNFAESLNKGQIKYTILPAKTQDIYAAPGLEVTGVILIVILALFFLLRKKFIERGDEEAKEAKAEEKEPKGKEEPKGKDLQKSKNKTEKGKNIKNKKTKNKK